MEKEGWEASCIEVEVMLNSFFSDDPELLKGNLIERSE